MWFIFLQTADSTICSVSPSQTDMDNGVTSKKEILTPEIIMAEEKIEDLNRSGESTNYLRMPNPVPVANTLCTHIPSHKCNKYIFSRANAAIRQGYHL